MPMNDIKFETTLEAQTKSSDALPGRIEYEEDEGLACLEEGVFLITLLNDGPAAPTLLGGTQALAARRFGPGFEAGDKRASMFVRACTLFGGGLSISS